MKPLSRVQLIYARPPHVWLQRLWAYFLCVLALSVAYSAGSQMFSIEPPPTVVVPHFPSIAEMVVEESSRAGISAHLPLAIAWRESGFNPLAISATQDFGVMQLNRYTARVLHVANPLDPRQNIIAGVGLLAGYLTLCHGERSAVYAYARGRCKEKR